MTAREAILRRLTSPTPADALALEADALLIDPERPPVDATMMEETFRARLTLPSVAATIDTIAYIGDLPAAVAQYCRDHDLPLSLCVPPDPRMAASDWSGFALHDTAAPDEPVALAFARCGVAETGSLVFETGPTAPMLPNFLTLHHIVVVPRLVGYLEEAMLTGTYPRGHYWVTGVSGTTDIEGTYVRGAHGPRFLHVIRLGRD